MKHLEFIVCKPKEKGFQAPFLTTEAWLLLFFLGFAAGMAGSMAYTWLIHAFLK